MDETSTDRAPERGFRTPEEAMSGKGAVCARASGTRENWPYTLGDYLKAYIGHRVLAGCVLPNGRYFEKTGVLTTVGTNFIGLRPGNAGGLVLIDLASVKGVEIK